MRYPNGEIPKSELVYLGDEHWLTPGTAVRWRAFQEDVYANEGVWLYITPGPNAYRDIESQWTTYWNEPPGNAAYPSTSSHGGVYDGRDSMAIDVANWGQIGREKFYAYARKHGFEPGYFDWEPWHIIDWSPWDHQEELPNGGEEDEDMCKNSGIWWTAANGKQMNAVVNTCSGYFDEFESSDGAYNSGIALAFGTGSFQKISASQAGNIKNRCAEVRQGK